MRTALFAGLLAVAAVLLLGACAEGTGLTPPPAETRIDVDTPALRQAKAKARIAACPAPQGGSDLPAQTLPCLGGGRAVDLASVEGPAVLPLWASWCVRCPEELPLYQRLAEEAGDRLTVLGVDYQDTQPDAAIAMLREAGARFPQVADPGGTLADTYRVRGLPGVIWVRADGTATFDNAQPDSYAELVRLVSDRLGEDVTVPAAG